MNTYISLQLVLIPTTNVSSVVLIEVFQFVIHINGSVGIFVKHKRNLF